ncbi:MAG: PEP-CTERM sorting domain-containing protein [Fimbriimonadaceae bacterium]|nr:PEP-CTERM sorting domain-containing protein [Fimbriimonadaceae bacterium]QYK55480.1 MAG: PEP-CTERM sorting domain-containing protein [Fimbriimonadaceae bacterium]
MNKVLLTCVGATVFAVNASALNLIVNPGFETGTLTPWYQKIDKGGPENWHVTTADAASGRYSVTSRGNKLLYTAVTPTFTKFIVDVSFSLKNVDATHNAYRFFYLDGEEEFYVNANSSNWIRHTVTHKLAQNRVLVGFGVYGVYGGTQYRTYLDDVTINAFATGGFGGGAPVPEPATLLALPLLLGLMKRRGR